MYHKKAGLFYFIDEPQFAAAASRADLAHRLRVYRAHRTASNGRTYDVRRVAFGRYLIRMNTIGSPTACILTH